MPLPAQLPHYDVRQSYDWNYEHAPEPLLAPVADMPGCWTFCGRSIAAPLGIAAGPLLNGRWVLYYAALGYEVLTYKTVRSRSRACYPQPNLLPVRCGTLRDGSQPVAAALEMRGTWAVSFGMPSRDPAIWRADVERTRRELPSGKVLVVSVVATPQVGWSLDQLADDYAICARWAVESGADAVETNFSCPNVGTPDGQLYLDFQAAHVVAARTREALGQRPLIIKIGHMTRTEEMKRLVEAVEPFADALAMTNSIAAVVENEAGEPLFNAQRRGICGDAIREASVQQVREFARILRGRSSPLQIVGVGGASTAPHVRQYLEAGAAHVQFATAAMLRPETALRIRQTWTQQEVHSEAT
jgi:dihydroorotate dehydrogenase (NAD+) catalytic subunit